jgi:hypothetical protein
MVDTVPPSGEFLCGAWVMPCGVADRNRISKRIYIPAVPVGAAAGTCDAMHASPAWGAVAAAALAAFAGAFALARATAPEHGSSQHGLPALRAGGGAVRLPHLSQAPDLPALAVPVPVRTAAPAPPVAPSPAPRRKPPKPVVIVGSG